MPRVSEPELTLVSMTPYIQPKAATSKSKKPASAPYGTKVAKKAPQNPLFEKRSRTFGIGKWREGLAAVSSEDGFRHADRSRLQAGTNPRR